MFSYFITATRKVTLYSESEIIGYVVSNIKSGGGQYYSKSDFFNYHYNYLNKYYSFNPNTLASAECERKISSREEYFLQTIGNTTMIDNLLSLPNV
jgi:hypothetical protein